MTVTNVPDDPNAQPSILEDDAPTFESYAATMPETASGFLDAALPQVTTDSVEDDRYPGALTSSDAPAPRKSVNVSKKVRKAMNKFKGKVADVPIMWFHTQAKDDLAWELDADEKELITDSIETVFDVLDISFEIEPLSYTLTSIWWVISYPLLAFTFLFLTKKSLTVEKDKQAEEPQP